MCIHTHTYTRAIFLLLFILSITSVSPLNYCKLDNTSQCNVRFNKTRVVLHEQYLRINTHTVEEGNLRRKSSYNRVLFAVVRKLGRNTKVIIIPLCHSLPRTGCLTFISGLIPLWYIICKY